MLTDDADGGRSETDRSRGALSLPDSQVACRRGDTSDAKAALNGIFKSAIPLSADLQNRSMSSLMLTIQSLLDGTQQRKTAEAYELVKQLENAELLLQSTPDDHPLDDKERGQLTGLIKATQQLHFARP